VPQADVADEWKARLPGLNLLWKLTTGRPDVRIAVLDGPPDKASVAQPRPVPKGHIVPNGVVEHATLVQSIIAGSSDLVVPGIAPGCTVLSIPIFEELASQNLQPSCSQARLSDGIRSAIAEEANIINISAAQQADLLALSSELSGALQDALDRDILVVAAAGNQGCACDTIPASVAGVLAVGAHDDNGVPLLSSNWGPNQRAQGVIAPGRDVPGACVGGGLCRASGASFAAATVSGVPPQLGAVEMAGTYLAGRLDVSRAIDCLLAASAPIPTGEGNLSVNSLPEDGMERRDQRSSPKSARAQR
jgi:Subtilase family